MTEKTEYYELEMAYEFLDGIETESLSEEVAGNIMEAWGCLKSWLDEHRTHQPTFAVGEYYQWKHETDFDRSGIYKIIKISKEFADCIFLNGTTKEFGDVSISIRDLTPATAQQIAMFEELQEATNDTNI